MAQHKFEALVRELLGAGAVGKIDWRRRRTVCIAGESAPHDRNAVFEGRIRMDLVHYRVYDGWLLSLQLIESVPAAGGQAPAQPRSRDLQAAAGAAHGLGASETSVLEGLRTLFRELDDALTAWGPVEVEASGTTSPTGGS